MARAEVLGALLSLLSLWVFAAGLFWEAANRCLRWSRGELGPVDGSTMLALGSLAVAVNLALARILAAEDRHPPPSLLHLHSPLCPGGDHSYGALASAGRIEAPQLEFCGECGSLPAQASADRRDANLRAASLHVLADLAQATLVAACGLLIWRWPALAVLDPLCSLLFPPLVVAATWPLLTQVTRILLEGAPEHVTDPPFHPPP